MTRFRLSAWLIWLSPVVSGVAFYWWSAWLYSASGNNCGVSVVPGTIIPAQIPFWVFIVVPAFLVGWCARHAQFRWIEVAVVILLCGLATYITAFISHLLAANAYNCLG
jgi:hypothetical protein